METFLNYFGTFNVPNIKESLSASFTAPGLLPVEYYTKIWFSQDNQKEENRKEISDFNEKLKLALNTK